MRRFEHALLLGLQHLYVSCREELEALLRELNALLVREGHAVAGKPPGAVLDGRVDSFVVKTDVHDPMDVNLLWDAMRVLLTEVSVGCGSHGVSGWRQGQYWRNPVRQGYQRVSRARLWHRRSKAVAAWLTLCGDLTGRLGGTLEVLAGWPEGSVSPRRSCRDGAGFTPARCVCRIGSGVACWEGTRSRTRRSCSRCSRPHTRWIMKGKAGQPVELGVPLTVLEDQHPFILEWQLQWHGGDVDVAVPLVAACQAQYPELRGCSFDRGFHSPANHQQLATMLEHVALPAKGRGTEASRAREGAASFVARRRRHPGVESAIHALESHGLERVRTHGREGFERTVGISILAANLHRLGRLLQQRAARRYHRTHAPPYRLAA